MYERTNWKDRIVKAGTGEVLQEGTDQNAANFNNMEAGISDHHVAMSLTRIARSNVVAKITNILQGVKTSNFITEIRKGKAYDATLEAVDDVPIEVTVKMGGVDVTDSVFDLTDGSGKIGHIRIGSVTGDIEIIGTNE